MTIQEILDKYNGKTVDFDGFYGNQCVDWYRQYCKELGVPQSPGVIGAKDIWTTYLKDYFDRIRNDPNAIPQLGDIIVWDAFTGNQYGHVSVFNSGDINSFSSYDQNWPVNSPVHQQPHNYDNVLGWLRPKKLATVPTPIEWTDQTLIPVGGEWGEVQLDRVRSLLNDMKRDLDSCDGNNKKLQENLAKVEKQLSDSKVGETALMEKIIVLQRQLETLGWNYQECMEKPPVVKEVEVIKFIKPNFANRIAKMFWEIAVAIEGK